MASKISFETAKELGLKLPSVEVSIAYGKPALKVHGKPFACMPAHKSAEPDSLVVRVDLEQRAELMTHDPSVFYITEHYKDYPGVLVRLNCVTRATLSDLLGMAHRIVAAETVRKGKTPISGSTKTHRR